MLWLAMVLSVPAQDPPTRVDEQIVVDDREAELRREVVVARLRALGYHMGANRKGYTVFEPKHVTSSDRWKPTVHLYDEGFVVLIGGAMRHAGLRKRQEVVEGIEPEMREWRVAIQAKALEHRLWEELPAELDAIWHDETTEPETRRAALVAYWVSRTCTPEGAAVRDAIRTYIVEEVQGLAWPVTAEETTRASRDNECEAVLEL